MSSETREISHCHGLKGPSNGESPFLNNTFEPCTIQSQVRRYSKHELTLDILPLQLHSGLNVNLKN